MKMRALLATAIGLTVFVTGCSTPTNEVDPGKTPDPNATFRFADVLPIDSLDPHTVSGAGYNVWMFPVYDRLIHLSPSSELKPGLATKWEFTPDGKTFKLTLRENIKFTDGNPFNAEAVKANLDRAKTEAKSTV